MKPLFLASFALVLLLFTVIFSITIYLNVTNWDSTKIVIILLILVFGYVGSFGLLYYVITSYKEPKINKGCPFDEADCFNPMEEGMHFRN